MKSEAPTSFEEIVNSFFENPKGQKPDTKALAKLLRSQEPLPPHFRIELAEMLDSRLSDTLACNWTLKPFYIGRYDEAPAQRKKRAETEATIGREIDAAIKREKSVESAIQQMVDDGKTQKRERTIWTIWRKIRLDREWRRMFREAPDSEAARRTIAERLAKRKD